MKSYYFKWCLTILPILSAILVPFARGAALGCAALLVIVLLLLRILAYCYFSDKIKYTNVRDFYKIQGWDESHYKLENYERDVYSALYGMILMGFFSFVLILIIDWSKVFNNLLNCVSEFLAQFPLFGL